VVRIVETEAYTRDDPACHGWRLREKYPEGEIPRGKGSELFGPPGHAYIYLCYGVHWLFNVITERKGTCGAVLVRGVEPVEGIDVMRRNRSSPRREVALTNGPGKLTQALDIDDRFHEQPLTGADLYLAAGDLPPGASITETPRIGISRATDRNWRFLIDENPYVSPG
jgi:DNA-3-methyladenine glycosylase